MRRRRAFYSAEVPLDQSSDLRRSNKPQPCVMCQTPGLTAHPQPAVYTSAPAVWQPPCLWLWARRSALPCVKRHVRALRSAVGCQRTPPSPPNPPRPSPRAAEWVTCICCNMTKHIPHAVCRELQSPALQFVRKRGGKERREARGLFFSLHWKQKAANWVLSGMLPKHLH